MKHLTFISTIRIKEIGFHVFKHDFSLVFYGKIYPRIKNELQVKQSMCHSKKFSFLWIERFIERVQKLSQLHEMIVTTISNKRYMTYYILTYLPMQMVEFKVKMILDENFQRKKSLNRSVNPPLIRKHSYIPFPKYNLLLILERF